ncbi:hypothetical protein LA303_05420 [Candidatus Sulfidibacterium hydrothermale]|uniref:hypothetical protein n=1 Tax=Candidatus Sulfidibacterium hydrothermale TaxID=2875962 RepID=UPI001F0A6F23|nr:hypothetical protein [Candidatus Sulfidibacterium hydrothermale]UBM63405.1 hypothetical protein LA303_05420 [Candidatus Sulfidibacterium hydrothermale]
MKSKNVSNRTAHFRQTKQKNIAFHKTLFILLVFWPSALTYAQNLSASVPKLAPTDIEVISEAYHLWKTKGDNVWPGWTKINMPFVYKKKHFEYRINFPATARRGRFVEKIGKMDVYGLPVSDSGGMAASMDVDHVPAVVLSSPEITGMTKERWIITAQHEMFHVFQDSDTAYRRKIKSLKIGYGKDASWMLHYPFPYRDSLLNTIAHMQGYLSFKIYRSDNLRESLYDSFFLNDILALYKNYLHCRYGSNNDYKYAVFQQSVEGTAKYTEIKMAEIAQTDYVPLHPDLHFTDDYTNQINVIRHCGKGTGGRLTFYYLGTGMCFVLDKINPDWKKSYLSTAWLNKILAASLQQIMEKHKTATSSWKSTTGK